MSLTKRISSHADAELSKQFPVHKLFSYSEKISGVLGQRFGSTATFHGPAEDDILKRHLIKKKDVTYRHNSQSMVPLTNVINRSYSIRVYK